MKNFTANLSADRQGNEGAKERKDDLSYLKH